MKTKYVVIMFLAAFLLQPVFTNLIPFFGTNVNLILCLAVVTTFVLEENYAGMICGFAFALLNDLVFGVYLGPGPLSIMMTVVILLIAKIFFNWENVFVTAGVLLAGTWLYSTIYWLIYFIIGSRYTYLAMLKTMPLQLLFNCVVGMAIYFVLVKKITKHKRDRYFI